MIEELKKKAKEELSNQHFDSLALSLIDFSKHKYESFEITPFEPKVYFDLASLTKPLTLSATFLANPELQKETDFLLLLNHQASLPSWARLSHSNWREQVLSYKIKKGETLYSDLGALRLMLEIEKKLKKSLFKLSSPYFDKELCFWKDLPANVSSPFTGFRNGNVISGSVHDDNCHTISEFSSHAGLFSTIDGISKTLINLDKKLEFIKTMKAHLEKSTDRFVLGFDTARDDEGLAGKGHSKITFGHLGFTGTSFWIDPVSLKGMVLLTNATQNFWYDRQGLNSMRRYLSSMFWENV